MTAGATVGEKTATVLVQATPLIRAQLPAHQAGVDKTRKARRAMEGGGGVAELVRFVEDQKVWSAQAGAPKRR